MKIKVTQEHIENGERNNGLCCPIANAIKDYYKEKEWELWEVCVEGYDSISINDLRYEATSNVIQVSDFIENFDFNREVEPFEFEIDGVDDCEI